MAVQAREEFVQMLAGYANISSVPKKFGPTEQSDSLNHSQASLDLLATSG